MITPTLHPSVTSQTYAQATSDSSPNNTIPARVPDLNNAMTSFLEDFKLLINPLIAVLTKVISSHLDKK